MSDRQEHQTSPVTFRFSNIGPVKEAALKLGELTVIAGRNNTGKTYIAYSLYGFLKQWRGWPSSADVFANTPADFPEIVAIRDGIRSTGRAAVPISLPTLAQQRKILAGMIGRDFSPEFRNVFNSRRDSFRSAGLRIEIDDATAGQLPSPVKVKFGHWGITMHCDGGSIIASLNASDRSVGEVYPEATAVAYYIFVMQDLFPDPFILSAERFGISLFYKELDLTKNQIVDLLQKYSSDVRGKPPSPVLIVNQATSRYAMPIKDNIDFTRDIPNLPRDLSPLADHRLFDSIKDMLEGYYSNASDDIRFISKARKKGRFNIPLHLASSSARGLSDLYFFLRHSAERGQLLIIDEPESHLDTRNQVQFARLLARFVGAGLRVVITTHSDYIVKELNNLIMVGREFPDKGKVAKSLGYCSEDELTAEQVRAYVAEHGVLTECNIGPYGIEMPVFDRTIDDINQAAIELSSRTIYEAAG